MNTISDEEHKERSFKLFEKTHKTKQDIDELYFLHNDRIRPRKKGRCSKCMSMVWNNLKRYYGQ